jgi:hypothetical protein
MPLLTTVVELRVVGGRSRTGAGRPHAVSGWPILRVFHICHAHSAPMLRCAVALRSRFQHGMARERRGLCKLAFTGVAVRFSASRANTVRWAVFVNDGLSPAIAHVALGATEVGTQCRQYWQFTASHVASPVLTKSAVWFVFFSHFHTST